MLHIHRAERADRLADALADALLEPLGDPFAADVLAVPTRGIERWLTQRLSTRLGAAAGRADGVCANVEFPFPGRLIQTALAAATGIDPEHDPWLAERSVWPLLETVDECLGEPWLATLELHLQGACGEGEPLRRFGVVRHIADLFHRYGVHRPEMIRAWAAAADEAPDHDAPDPFATDAWQPELWRRLRARIGRASPAERLAPACARIRSEPELLDLPPRVSLFGLTRIPRSYIEVLAAIATYRDVHLFVLHPSPRLWQEVRASLDRGPATVSRHEDRTAALPSNRLLASWGRDARELQLVLRAAGPAEDHHHELPRYAHGTLLEAIQTDIREDRQPLGPPLLGELDTRPRLEANDRSLQIHACHGRARQVEVLRDAVLHLLEDDPTLEPRDVIVMCPDIETFAPLIQATFGAAGRTDDETDHRDQPEPHALPDLRVRLADRSLRQTNPVLGVVGQLLALADQRATASQLLDLAAREPVRRRFGFDDDDLSRMQEWVAASGIRWGFDAAHREPFKLGSLEANTWRSGLDRVLVGATMTEDERRLVGGVLPLDDVDSAAIGLAGRFAEYVDRARAAADALSQPKPVTEWTTAIAEHADALTATSDREAWQRRELDRLLDDVATESSVTPAELELELADIRALFAERLRGRPTRANFRTGHLTVCTLVPMRSVPHRVVCVLGLDDGEFPRKTMRDGDDMMLNDAQVGDRDPRAEDRQMLLDALMAATERLIITYTGNDERTNQRRPPAVPVGELLDIVERTVSSPDGSSRDQILTNHPLQPFDPRNFAGEHPWGFDPHALQGARALTGPRRPRPSFLEAPLPEQNSPVVELESLIRFVENPIRTLLRDRIGITVSEYLDEVQDTMPVELDSLAEWAVGQRLLDGVLAGADLTACMHAEIARGTLPPGQLARPPLHRIAETVNQLARATTELARDEPRSLDIHVPLPDGRILAGTVTGVCADTIRAISYSRVRPKDRLRAWVKLLALTAARPEQPWQASVIGRARAGAYHADVSVSRLRPMAEDPPSRSRNSIKNLTALLDLYDRGMREPLPLACNTSAAYAQHGAVAAGKAWKSEFEQNKEDRLPEHLLVYGRELPAAELLADPRFAACANQLWSALLEHESWSDR
jgi:exodeoxyribonuclease V gamma subunit